MTATTSMYAAGSGTVARRQRTASRRALKGSVLDSLPAHIAVVDSSGSIVQVNDAWRRFGCSNSAANADQNSIGVNYLEVCSSSSQAGDASASKAAEGLKSVLRGELASFQFEYPCHSPTQERWFRMNVTPMVGEIDGAVVSHEDITESKLKDAALRASEARRKVAMDSGRVAIWERDLKTNHLIWDESCFALYQISKGEFKGTVEEWTRTIHHQDVDAVIQAFQAAVAGTREYDLTFRIVWPNGEVRHVKAHGEVLRDGDGVAQRIIGTNWDITEQKRHEDALQSSIQEKSALLKEVHHRVNNNLQVITSLLRLESHRSTEDHTKAVLGAMQARIRAMALLHESLYRSGTFASIDLGSYLRQLATQAFQAQWSMSTILTARRQLSLPVEAGNEFACLLG